MRYSNCKQRKILLIKNSDDFKEKINIAYEKWETTGFSESWIKNIENRWLPCTNVWRFIELLKAKKELSAREYKEKEEEIINDINNSINILKEFQLVIEAEEQAFNKAGIKEGRVEYTCPLCGGLAIANRYKYGNTYHGLGSGCTKCGVSHT